MEVREADVVEEGAASDDTAGSRDACLMLFIDYGIKG